jgi:hypothetical protein
MSVAREARRRPDATDLSQCYNEARAQVIRRGWIKVPGDVLQAVERVVVDVVGLVGLLVHGRLPV